MSSDTPTADPAELPFVDYVQYRVKRDLGGAAAWFVEKWRASLLFKLFAFAVKYLDVW